MKNSGKQAPYFDPWSMDLLCLPCFVTGSPLSLTSSKPDNLLLFFSELILSFLWQHHRPSKWRPVTWSAYPERLPGDENLPPVDVFICTTDPSKEPPLWVMNTVILAMAMDYPPDKLAVYLSDDGGAPLTLSAMKEAWRFAVWWIPFCRKYEVKTRCPDAYFRLLM